MFFFYLYMQVSEVGTSFVSLQIWIVYCHSSYFTIVACIDFNLCVVSENASRHNERLSMSPNSVVLRQTTRNLGHIREKCKQLKGKYGRAHIYRQSGIKKYIYFTNNNNNNFWSIMELLKIRTILTILYFYFNFVFSI